MSNTPLKTLVPCLVVVLAAVTLAPAHAAHRCDAPRTGLDVRVCAIAAQGSTDLRRFIQRTRMIYGLQFQDYARPERGGVAGSSTAGRPKVAAASDRPTSADSPD